ncbi:MAG: carbon-nitrogen hydrolase family protein [Acidobacteriia bacterium]|nr:carbon-nitrogen hydrolase family protein [Terriglobia bacterium]
MTITTYPPAVLHESTLRVAMVFPPAATRSSKLAKRSSKLVPRKGSGAQEPEIPTTASFASEAIDVVLFPEAYISACDRKRTKALKKLAADLRAQLVVGAEEESGDFGGRVCQVLLQFDPDGSISRAYTKHSTAEAVAFERPDWQPRSMLPTIELGGVTAGATICHDHYLGLLPRFLAKRGALVWINPSFDNVTEIKWSSVLRLRAVENRCFSLCTLHSRSNGRRTHPFAFSPDGAELCARRAGVGAEKTQPLSKCREGGNIYVVDLDLAAAGEPLDWSKLPPAKKPQRARNGEPRRPVRVTLRGGQPTIVGCSSRNDLDSGFHGETAHGPVYVGVVPGERILDASECFRVLDRAKRLNCSPIIWNHWDQLPTESGSLATLMMGRAIECCAPVVISDRVGIRELVELSNRNKIPTRRVIDSSGEAIVDLGYAWGLDNAFKMVANRLPAKMRKRMTRIALDHYRKLLVV